MKKSVTHRSIHRFVISLCIVLSSFSHFAAAQEQTIALGEIDLTSIREYQGVNEEFLAGVSDKMKELLKSKEIAVLIITTNGTCYCRTISSTRCVLEEQSGTNPVDYSLLREGLENQVFQKWLEIKRIKINRKFYSNEIGKLLRDIHELNVYQEDKTNLLAAVGGIIIELPPQQRLQLQEEPHIGAQVRASMTNFRLYELGKSENIYSGSFKTGKDEVSSDVVNLFSEFGDESVQKVGFTSVSPGLGILSRETAPGFRVYIGPAIDPNSSSGKIWNEDFLRIIKNKTVDGLLKDKDVGFYYGFDGSKTVTKIDKIAYMAELRESLGFNL